MQKALIKDPVAPLFARADRTSERTDEALGGMRVDILGDEGAFAYIQTPYRYRGYVDRDALCEGIPDGWAPGDRWVVQALFADVQAEPRIQSAVLETLPKGARILVRGDVAGQWAQVATAGGTTGYMKSMNVAPARGAPQGSEEEQRLTLMEEARAYLNAPYRWGGKTPMGIDCSGLCSMAYLLCGYTIFRDASVEEGFDMEKIDPARAKPGDLLFFPGHVAMLLGGGRFIHATSNERESRVVYASLDAAHADYHEKLAAGILYAGTVFR